jgi:hypothetical protein
LEYFRVNLSNPVNASIQDGQSLGWIDNDDVRITIPDVHLVEGHSGTTPMVFTVALSATYDLDVSVDWSTEDGSATSPTDYLASSGTVFIPAGSPSATLEVPVVGETLYEGPEYFRVHLSNPVNASIADSQSLGWIDNDDVRIAISNEQMLEGDSGTLDLEFSITLSDPYELEVQVDFSTSDGGAVSPEDYLATSGTVIFPPETTLQTIGVPVVGDEYREGNEYFNVDLSNPVNASISKALGIGTINNDDQYPTVSIGDLAAVEGSGGTTNFQFLVTLSASYVEEVRVWFTTDEGTATAPEDFVDTTAELIFPIGETLQYATVPVVGDFDVEPNETFEARLFTAVRATIADAIATGTIQNDDLPAGLSIADMAAAEGDAGTTDFVFTVSLSEAIGATVQVGWATADGAAIGDDDYVPSSGTVIFPPWETTQTLAVPVIGDIIDECPELFYVDLFDPVNGTIGDSRGAGTIQSDDYLACTNIDGDCFHDPACGGLDCDDSDPATYPGAPEANDAADNQCPGDWGFGVVDEVSGVCGFHTPGDETEFSWPDQAGATMYRVARSPLPDFSSGCLLLPDTPLPYLNDMEALGMGEIRFYLVKPFSVNDGSWGYGSDRVERVFTCPSP